MQRQAGRVAPSLPPSTARSTALVVVCVLSSSFVLTLKVDGWMDGALPPRLGFDLLLGCVVGDDLKPVIRSFNN
jgi:hypothetical protein